MRTAENLEKKNKESRDSDRNIWCFVFQCLAAAVLSRECNTGFSRNTTSFLSGCLFLSPLSLSLERERGSQTRHSVACCLDLVGSEFLRDICAGSIQSASLPLLVKTGAEGLLGQGCVARRGAHCQREGEGVAESESISVCRCQRCGRKGAKSQAEASK